MWILTKLYDIYDETTNIYSLFYCIYVTIISAFTLFTGTCNQYVNLLTTATTIYMLYSLPKHIIDYIKIKLDFKKLQKCMDEQKIIKTKKSLDNKRQKAIELILHHIFAISIVLHIPSLDHNIQMCNYFHCKLHLAELSTIFLSLTSSKVIEYIFLKNNVNTKRVLEIIFILTFFLSRIFYVLPSLTLDVWSHNFMDDYLWQAHILTSAVLFWTLHIVWTVKIISKIKRMYTKPKTV